MKFAARSDRGKVREVNEDSHNIIAGFKGMPAVFMIADGMGGHNSGEVASKTAVDFATNYIIQFPEILSVEENVTAGIMDIVKKANSNVYVESRENEANFGMGTTFIIAVALNEKLYVGHVGDSRVYMVRNGDIKRITTDHSYIEELVKTGSLTREEAENHPNKNIITRALGCYEDIQVDIYTCDMQAGDSFVLCTDGLTNKLSETEIKEIIIKSHDPESACVEMIKKANEKGGEDNITVVVVKND